MEAVQEPQCNQTNFRDEPGIQAAGNYVSKPKIAFFTPSAGPPPFVPPRNMHKHFVFLENDYKLATVSSANER